MTRERRSPAARGQVRLHRGAAHLAETRARRLSVQRVQGVEKKRPSLLHRYAVFPPRGAQPPRFAHPLADVAWEEGVQRLAQESCQTRSVATRGNGERNAAAPDDSAEKRRRVRGIVHRIHQHTPFFRGRGHVPVHVRRRRRNDQPHIVHVARNERAPADRNQAASGAGGGIDIRMDLRRNHVHSRTRRDQLSKLGRGNRTAAYDEDAATPQIHEKRKQICHENRGLPFQCNTLFPLHLDMGKARRWRAPTLLFCAAALVGPASTAHAARLPGTTTPSHYDLAFDVELSRARFSGVETIRVANSEPTDRIVLHAVEIAFDDVTIAANGATQKARVTLDRANQTATLSVAKALPSGSAEIHIRYTGILNNELRGLYLSQANGRRYAVSQLESTDARRMFPSFDEPVYKATFSLSATIDRGDTAISNGRVISDVPAPGAARHTLTFATSPKMSSYLVALAVGDFVCLDGQADGTPLRVCATPDRKALGQFALESAEYVLHYYNSYYATKYPFEKLDMVAVPDFAAGAMENTGAIFYRDTDLLVDTSTASVDSLKNVASVVAHEMAHQWFGDLVTMKWWDDLWLNEGFATWMESRPLAVWKPEWHMEVDQALDTQRAIALDSLKSTHAIRSRVETPAEIDESFDLIAYQKGAAIVRMIENYVGADAFQKGVNAYVAAHAYGNATSEDFAAAIAAASGKPVDRILPTFVNQPGVPLLQLSLRCEGTTGTIRMEQAPFTLGPPQAPGAGGETRWEIPVCSKRGSGDASCDVLALQTAPTQSLGTGEACTTATIFGNAGALGYYRTQYTPDALNALAATAEKSLTAPERVSLVGDDVGAGPRRPNDDRRLPDPGVRFRRRTIERRARGSGGRAHICTRLPHHAGQSRRVRGVRAWSLRSEIYRSRRRGECAKRQREPGHPADRNRADGPCRKRSRRGPRGARTALDAALAGTTPLDATAAASVVAIAAAHGDAALWDAMASAAKRSASPQEQYRYLYGLGAFTDPALVERGLDYVLSPNVRTQNAGAYLEQFLTNPSANQTAWTFLKVHWKDLEPRLSVAFADVGVVQALGSFCDAGARDDIQAFFTTHKLGNAARNVDQAVERINNCINLKATQTQVLDAWLKK